MRRRLLFAMLGVVALVLVVHDVPLARHIQSVERDRLNTKLERDAFILGGRAESALDDGTIATDSTIRALVLRYNAEEDVRVVIVDAAGVGVVGSDDAVLDEDFTNRPEIETALSGRPITGERYSETLGEQLFFVAVPVWSGDVTVGMVRLSAPERVVSERAGEQVRGLFLVAGISLLIAGAVAWLVAKSLSEPLRNLRNTTHALAAGDLSVRADESDGPGEVQGLAGSFNLMASRTQQLVERQRAFAGTASHQLRTPLTALRLRLEQLAIRVSDGVPADDPDAQDVVHAAIEETDRLHRMIEGLLALTRAEDAAVGPVVTQLSTVVAERAEHWAPLAEERGVSIVTSIEPGVTALTVAGSTEQIVDNYLDNALEVSPPGSTIELRVTAGSHVAELHVIDEGPGLTETERVRAFERFWRGEGAEVGGSGLGLAIVQQLAAAAEGTTELRAAPGGGVDAVAMFRRS